jgi:CheY-specific phosphatase CheX/anti-anti-sigma regulatory factor
MSELFRSEEKDGIHIITLPSLVDSKNTPQLERAMHHWRKSHCHMHVIDLKEVIDFMPSAYRPFVQFYNDLKLQDKMMLSVNVPAKILPRFKLDGVDSVFNPTESLAKAYKILNQKIKSTAKPKMSVELINPFIEATLNFMKVQANLEVTAQKPTLKKVGEYNKFQVAGRMRIQSLGLAGSVIIAFNRDVFEKLYDQIMGPSLDDQVRNQMVVEQAAGEILNIIFGQAKAILSEKNQLQLDQSLPEILIGEDYKIHEKMPALVVPFQSAIGNFYLEVGFLL